MVEMFYYSAASSRGMDSVVEDLKADGWNITEIDVDQDPERAKLNGVQAVPTFIICRDQQPVRRITGVRQRFSLETELRLTRDGS